MTRNRYTREFKLDAVSLVLDQGYSHAEAARSLEINPNMLSRWIKEHDSDDGHAFRGNGKLPQGGHRLNQRLPRWMRVIVE